MDDSKLLSRGSDSHGEISKYASYSRERSGKAVGTRFGKSTNKKGTRKYVVTIVLLCSAMLLIFSLVVFGISKKNEKLKKKLTKEIEEKKMAIAQKEETMMKQDAMATELEEQIAKLKDQITKAPSTLPEPISQELPPQDPMTLELRTELETKYSILKMQQKQNHSLRKILESVGVIRNVQ